MIDDHHLVSVCKDHKWLKKGATISSKYSIFLTEYRQEEGTTRDSQEQEEEQEESAYSQLPDDLEESLQVSALSQSEGGVEGTEPGCSPPDGSPATGSDSVKQASGTAAAKSHLPNLGRFYVISGKNGAIL